MSISSKSTESILFIVQVKDLLGTTVVLNASKDETIEALKYKYFASKPQYRPPVQRWIALGQQLQNKFTLERYPMKSPHIFHMIPALSVMYLKIDHDKYYMHPTDSEASYWDSNDISGYLKKDIQNKLNETDNDDFWIEYDLFHEDERCKLNHCFDRYSRLACIELQLKTTNSKIWYMKHQRILYDQRCTILVFGYVGIAQRKFKLDIPAELKQMCKIYYHRLE